MKLVVRSPTQHANACSTVKQWIKKNDYEIYHALLISICTPSYGAAQQKPGASQTQLLQLLVPPHIGDGTVLATVIWLLWKN